MKWVVVALILCLATFCRGGVLKCTPSSKDEACITEKKEKVTESIKLVAVQRNKEAECLAGSEWESNCHKCRCSVTGKAVCSRLEICDKNYGEPIRCKPNTSFKKDCNTCRCLENGMGLCTLKGCLSSTWLMDTILETKKNDEIGPVLRSPVKSVVCEANRMFIKDCNTCWCNDDGTSYFCTRKVCVDDLIEEVPEIPIKIHEVNGTCRPDEVFELDCNMCRCNPDGLSFSCTRRACPVEEDFSLKRRTRSTSQQSSRTVEAPRFAHLIKETPKNCQPGQEFRMDCNKCLCDNEGRDFSCTRIDCVALNSNSNGGTRARREVSTYVQTDCTPGSVFSQECNTCRCTADGGHATCTIKQCNNKEADLNLPESDPNFRCNPGEQFQRNCNDCTCSADGRSIFCTLRLCDI